MCFVFGLKREAFRVSGFSGFGVSVSGFKYSTLLLQAKSSSLLKSVGRIGLSLYDGQRVRDGNAGRRSKVNLWKEPTPVQKWIRKGADEIRYMREKEREL
jgi:hypothetical protein